MLKLPAGMQIVIATEAIDMRKSIDGLSVAVVEQLSKNPQSNQLYIFHNRRGDKVKLLYWDRNGFCLFYKKLERGRFCFPTGLTAPHFDIDEQQLSWLLAGFDFMGMASYPELNFTHYF